jgi:1-acyl-sn-glycerol-3-phosphate acyltransferase
MWARGVTRLIGMRVHLAGHSPKPPFLLVANHLSYVDIVVLARHLDCVFVAKRDVRNWPVLGRIIKRMDTIFVDRTRRGDVVPVNGQIEQALQHGDGVVLFAEGTSTAGQSVAPFKPALLDSAARAHIPVWHASLTYSEPSVCWYGDMTFPGHFFELLKCPGFTATLTFGDEPVCATDRKELARRLHAEVSTTFQPIREAQ